MRRSRVRSLRPGEPIPEVEPGRYRNNGYVRLRWLVGPQSYVEEFEHRVNAGRPDPSMHVHHLNGVKDDNRPENLMILTPQEHGRLHAAIDRDKDPMHGQHFGGYRSRAAQEKALRAQARRQRLRRIADAMREDYEAGMSTVDLAQKYHLSAGTVSRRLRTVGTVMRYRATGPAPRVRQTVKARACLRCEVCGRRLTYEPSQLHHRRPRAMGGSRRHETNEPQNLLHVCVRCHLAIESDRSWALAEGLLVRQDQDPAEVAVRLHHGWVRLTDDGRYELPCPPSHLTPHQHRPELWRTS